MGSKVLEKVKQKPYFSDKSFVLYQADSIEFLKSLDENTVDMIFADPPYNLSNGGFTVHAGWQMSVNKRAWNKSNRLKYEIII